MPEAFIALNGPLFWGTVFLGIVVTGLTRGTSLRNPALAFVNAGFLILLLRLDVIIILALLLVAWLALKAGRNSKAGPLVLAAVGAGTLYLFVIHKGVELPGVNARLLKVMSAISFSFIALRFVEVMRAVWEERHPPPDLPTFVNYIVPFHMLAAGPIQAYDEFAAQADGIEKPSPAIVLAGAERIATGLFKKFVIAFAIREAFLTDFQVHGPYELVELQFFVLWLYFDFSAYSDIAVGIGRLMGVATPENFNNPLTARNLIVFWERWHISLSMFIRRNLFIPLQLAAARRGMPPKLSAALAIILAFELCGLWHGFAISWPIWGLLQGIGLAVVRLYGDFLQQALGPQGMKAYRSNVLIRWVCTAVTFEYLVFTWYPFLYFGHGFH
jgi:D-alanyl-lipoteichoic acid acyltransferase DltB (MBOAT superfamily)